MSKSNDGIPLGKKKGIHIPNTPALLLIVALIVAVLTYIIPAGTFERQFDEANNRTLVVAGMSRSSKLRLASATCFPHSLTARLRQAN